MYRNMGKVTGVFESNDHLIVLVKCGRCVCS